MDPLNLIGDMRIEPPIPWAAISASPFLPREHLPVGHSPDTAMMLVLDDARSAVEVAGRWDEDDYAALETELQAMVNAHPDHQFVGSYELEDRYGGGVYRVSVGEDRKVQSVSPLTVWPGTGIIPAGFTDLDLTTALRTLVELWNNAGDFGDLSVRQREVVSRLAAAAEQDEHRNGAPS